jgi:hypothetical protein
MTSDSYTASAMAEINSSDEESESLLLSSSQRLSRSAGDDSPTSHKPKRSHLSTTTTTTIRVSPRLSKKYFTHSIRHTPPLTQEKTTFPVRPSRNLRHSRAIISSNTLLSLTLCHHIHLPLMFLPLFIVDHKTNLSPSIMSW